MLLLAAAMLPRLFWDAAPTTAAEVRAAGIAQIAVPAARAEAWKGVTGITIEIADPAGAVKMEAPSVNYRANQGSATREPWLNCNPWQFLRKPQATFIYTVRGEQAALAAAEAFTYDANALIGSDAAGLQPLGRMLEFLRGVSPADLAPVADIGFVDDNSNEAGEVLNLMVRGNLLVRLVKPGDRSHKLTVQLGTKEYPREQAQNPAMMAHLARANLTDDKRSLRLYGSAVVLGRLTAAGNRMRVQLLNYAGAERKVDGLRVRVLGRYPNHRIAAAGSPGEELVDYTVAPDATEFTLPELKSFAVIDLSR